MESAYKADTEGMSEAKKRAYLHEEMAAESCFDALSNDAFFDDFRDKMSKTEEGQTFLQKLAQFFADLAKQLKKAVQGYAARTNNEMVRELMNDSEMLDHINTRFRELLESAEKVAHSENTATGETMSQKSLNTYSEYDKPITVEDVLNIRAFGKHSINELSQNPDFLEAAQKWAYKYFNEMGTKSPFFRAWFGEWRAFDKKTRVKIVDITQGTFGAGKAVNSDTGRCISWGDTLRQETENHRRKAGGRKSGISIEFLSSMSNIVESAVMIDTRISQYDSKNKMPNTAFMHHFYSLCNYNDEIILVRLLCEEALPNVKKDGSIGEPFTRAYELKDIEKVTSIAGGVLSASRGLTKAKEVTTYSISDLFAFVKEYDKEFKPNPVNEKLLEPEPRTPMVLYYGTDGTFAEFDPNEMRTREGSFFLVQQRNGTRADERL